MNEDEQRADQQTAAELASLMGRVTPPGPDPTARVGSVRNRVRRSVHRRAGTTVLAAAGVVAAALIAPHYVGAGPAPQSSSATSTAPVPLSHPYACPDVDDGAGGGWLLRKVSNNVIPAGAALARLCALPFREDGIWPAWPNGWSAPQDALTRGVDHLAAQFNNLVESPAASCVPGGPAVGATDFRYQLTLQYPDGSVVRVGSDAGRCGGAVLAGSGRHTGKSSQRILTTYLSLLSQQRMTRQAPGYAGAAPACPRRDPYGVVPPAGLMPQGHDLGLVVARYCRYDFGRLHGGRVLSSSQVGELDRDYPLHLSRRLPPEANQCRGVTGSEAIVGRTGWGDVVVMGAAGTCGGGFVRQLSTSQVLYRPSAAGWAAVEGH